MNIKADFNSWVLLHTTLHCISLGTKYYSLIMADITY